METAGYIALFFVGLLLGTLGGGGSILSVPILVYLFSLDVVTATAYSLFIVGTASLVGSILKYGTRMIDIRTGIVFGIPSLTTIFVTRNRIIPSLPEIVLHTDNFSCTKRTVILIMFAGLMVLASIAMISPHTQMMRKKDQIPPLYMVVAGIVTGFLTGLVGAGGGFIIIPVLLYLTGLPFKTVVGTTLLIISVNSFAGFTGDVFNHSIDWPFLLVITGLAVSGIFIAGYFTQKLANDQLRTAFGWLVLATGLMVLLREVSFGFGLVFV
jgi:uncharacterized membrane protein YfcA